MNFNPNEFKCGCSKEAIKEELAKIEDWEINYRKKLQEILNNDIAPYWYCNGKKGKEHYITNYPKPWGSSGTTFQQCSNGCGKMGKKINEFMDEKQLEHECISKDDNPREREREREQFLSYFREHSIKSIKLENNKLVIEYNNSQTESKDPNNQELQAIKTYAEKLGKNEISLKDLEQSTSQTPKSNKVLYWGLGIVGVLVVGVVVWLVVKNNNKSK